MKSKGNYKNKASLLCEKEVRIMLYRIDDGLLPRKMTAASTSEIPEKYETKVKIDTLDDVKVKLETLEDVKVEQEGLPHRSLAQDTLNSDVKVKMEIKTESGSASNDMETFSRSDEIEVGEVFVFKADENEIDYNCEICQKSYKLQKSLCSHKHRVHGVKNWRCAKCPKSFHYNSELTTHLSAHDVEGDIALYTCEVCGQDFLTRDAYYQHRKRRHGLRHLQQNKCYFCGFMTAIPNQLEVHMRTHTQEKPSQEYQQIPTLKWNKNECADVVEMFSAKQVADIEKFRREIAIDLKNKVNKDGLWLTCKVCKKYKRKSVKTMKAHLAQHRDDNPFKCTTCGEIFLNIARLVNHMKMKHTDNTLRCPECRKTFKTEKSLHRHVRIVHNEKRVGCPKCPKTFHYRAELKLHLPLHEGDEKRQKHHCEVCNKIFISNGGFLEHIKRHEGVVKKNRFMCYFCGFGAYKKHELFKHLLVHTKERPFKCKMCKYCSTSKGNLKKHEEVHAGDQATMNCPVSGGLVKFRRRVDLIEHIKRHENSSE